MRKIFLLLLCCIVFFLLFFESAFSSSFTKVKIDEISLQYLSYDISDPKYKLKVVTSDNAQDLREMLIDNNAVSGINGIFFCPKDYRECNWKDYTINERFVNWQDLSFYSDTWERAVFAWDKDMNPFIFMTNRVNKYKRGEIFEWMWNFPLLLWNGNNTLPYYNKIGLLDKKMLSPSQRHFICSNKDSNTILIGRSSSTSLLNIPEVLKKIWCYNALNLDAGQSSHFIYNGWSIADGSRDIIDAFVIKNSEINVNEIYRKVVKNSEILRKRLSSYNRVDGILLKRRIIKMIQNEINKMYDQKKELILNNEWVEVWYSIPSLSDKEQETLLYFEFLYEALDF